MTDIKFDVIARDRASSTFNRVGASADQTSHSMSKFIKVAGAAAIGLGAVTAGAAVFAYKVGSDYVGSLNKIQALTGANDKTTQAAAKTLEANAGLYAKMGQTTGDAAAGVVELTKAGLSLHDSLKAVNATMVLAKAGELSVSDASTLVANSLNTFGLKAKDAGKIANQLANAANISSADVSDLAESFKYVAPVAASAGLSMGEVNAILAELSNSGIKASQAGTTLRTFLLNLQAPATAGAKALDALNVQVFDAQGNMKPLPQLIGELGGKLNGLPAKEKAADLKAIFGKVGIAGATQILKGGADGLRTYEKGVNRAGAAAKLAQANSKGLAGTFSTIMATLTSSAQSFYREFSPILNQALKPFADWLTRISTGGAPAFRKEIEKLTPQFKKMQPKVTELGNQIKDNLYPALKAIGDDLKKNGPQYREFVHSIIKATPPVVKLATAILGKVIPPLSKLDHFIQKLPLPLMTRNLTNAANGLGTLAGFLSNAGGAISRFAGAVKDKIGSAIDYIKSLPGKIKDAVGNLGSLLFSAGAAVIQGLIDGIQSKVSAVASKLSEITHMIPLHKGPIEKDRQLLRGSGRAIMDGLIKGLADRQIPLQAALSKVTDLISKVGDKISNLQSIRAGFKNTFSADSLFGADLSHTTTDAAGNETTTPETITDLINYQKEQADKARQLAADVKAVTKKGLSKALVRQLQSQGASGAAALHALATGSPAEIARLNALNKQTSRSLQDAGMRAGNYTRGGSIADDIRRAKKQEHVLELLEHHLKDLAASEKKDQTIVVEIDGEAVITAIKRRNARKGVKHSGV